MSKVDELRVKYPRMTTSVFNRFVEGDKTKTKKYLPFMLKTWVNKNEYISSSVELVKLVNMFDELLPYIENKDIYHKDYEVITYFLDVLNKAMVDKEENTFNKEEHIDVIEENDDYIMVHPKTHKGSLKYGANTKWCTASKNSASTFVSYSKSGYLVYLISKDIGIPNFARVAFYVRKNQDALTGDVEVYLANDVMSNSESLIKHGKWDANVIMKIITTIRLRAYNHQKVVNAQTDINNLITKLGGFDFDTLTNSIMVLEKTKNIDYIYEAKKIINDFVSKLEKINI